MSQQRTDSTIRTGSASITRLPGKGSKSIIPKGSTSAAFAGHQTPCQRSSTDEMIEDYDVALKTEKTMIQNEVSIQSNPVDQTPKNRVSALPTFTASRRTIAKTNVNPNSFSTTNKSKIGVNSIFQKRQLENQFSMKKQKYMNLRKELVEKQKQALDFYEDVAELREKVIAAGMKDPGKIEKIILHGKIEGRDSTTICEGAAGEQLSNYSTASVVTSEFIGTLEEKLKEIPDVCLNVCREVLNKRTENISLIFELNEKNPAVFEPEIIERLEIQRHDNEGLQSRVENVADKQQAVINELFEKTSALWGEHENYRVQIRELETSSEGVIRDLKVKLQATIEDLEIEQGKIAQLKERKNLTDAQLQKARNKIRELENHANSNEAKIQQLQGTIKNLETQIKQKEAVVEARTKDMHKSMKNSESLVAKTEKQRDSLETRVTELKKKIDSKEAEFNEKIKNISKQLEDTRSQLANEKDLKSQAEQKVKELTDRCAKLEEKSQQLCDLAETTKDLVVQPAVDGKHTDNEVQLWNELQSTRSALTAKEEKLLQVKLEKEKIISVLQEAADLENSGSIKDRLAVDLITRTEELQAANMERAQLQKDLKIALEKSENFSRQLSDLQSKLHAQSKEGGKSGWGAHTIELQQQLCDLRTTVKDLTRQNEELEIGLTQKQLEVEQRDRIMREQSKVLKVRDELIGLLKGQNGPNTNGELNGLQNGAVDQQMQFDPETINRLVNKQIAAKAEDLQSLYSTLESKQMQLMRLEKVVRQMEDDNDRSQATRTSLEREVAQLRLKLHEKNRDHRYVALKTAGFNPKILETSRKIINIDSRSVSQFSEQLPELPVLMPIRSRHSSANSMSINREKILNSCSPIRESPSVQKLKDIIRAVEIERSRGSANPRRVSRSLQRSNILKNSTEIREDLYNWLMHPGIGIHDAKVKREFVRHSRALLNGELYRSNCKRSNCEFRGDKFQEDNEDLRELINEGSREFRRSYDLGYSYLDTRPESFPIRTKSKRERYIKLK